MEYSVAVALALVLAVLLPGCIETRPVQGISTTVNVQIASTQAGICADPNLATCGAFVKEKRVAQNSWFCDGYNGPKETFAQKVSNGANRYIMNISDGWTCIKTSLPPEKKQITDLGILPDCRICYSGSNCRDYFNGDPTCTSYSGWIGHSCYGSTCACSTVYTQASGMNIKGKVADIHYDYYASWCGVKDPSAYVTTLSDLPPLPSQGTTSSFGDTCPRICYSSCNPSCAGCSLGGSISNTIDISLPGYGLRKTDVSCKMDVGCSDIGGSVSVASIAAFTTAGATCTPSGSGLGGTLSDSSGSYSKTFNCSRDAMPLLGDIAENLTIIGGWSASRSIYGWSHDSYQRSSSDIKCCQSCCSAPCNWYSSSTYEYYHSVDTYHNPTLSCSDTVSCIVSGVYDVNYECTNPYRSQPDGQKIFHFVNCLEGSTFQSFQGGTAYTNTAIPQTQLSSLLSQYTSDPNSKTTIPFFMLGQGPTFIDFEKARSKCNPYEDAKVSLSMGNTTFDPPAMRAQAGTALCFENRDSKVHLINITQSGAFVQNLTVGVGGTACGIQLPIGVYTAVDNNSDSSNVVITPRADGTVVYVGKRLTPDYTVVEKGRALVFNYFDDRPRNHTINTTLPTSTGTYSVVIGPSAPTTADDTPPGRRYVANTLGEFIMQDNVTNSKSMVFVASQENVFIFDQVGSANNGLLVAPLVEPGGTSAPYANSSAIVTGSHLARAFGDKVCFSTKVAGVTIDIQRERDGNFSTIDSGKLLASYPDLCCIEDELPGLYRAVASDGRSVTWLIGSSKPKATVSLQMVGFVPDQIDAQPYTSLCLFNPTAIDRTVLVTGPAFSATRKLGAFQSNDCSIALNAEGGYLAKFSPNIGVSASIGVSSESTTVINVLDLGFDPPFSQISPGKDVCWMNTADTPQVLIRTTSSGTQRLPPLKKGSMDCERAVPDGSVISRTQESSNVTSVVTASKNATFFILNGSGIQPPTLSGVSGGTLKFINMIDAPVSLYDVEDVQLTNNSISRTSISTITPVTLRFFNTDKRDHLIQMCSGTSTPCAESSHVTVPAGNGSQLGVSSAFEGYLYDSATAQSVVVSVNPLISSLDKKSLAGGIKTITLPNMIAYYTIYTSAGGGIAVLTLLPTVPAPTERVTMPETLDLPVQKVNYLTSSLLAKMRNYSSRGLVPAIVPDFKNVSVDVRTSVFDPQFAETLAGSTVTISNIDNIAHNIGMNKTKEYKYCTSNDPSHFSCIYNGAAGVCETMPNNVATSCDLTVSTTATPYCTNKSDDVICSYNAAGDYCEANATLDFVKVTPSSLCSVSPSRNFETIPSGTSATFNDVYLTTGYNGKDFIVGTSGTMLKSTDGGSTWSNVNPNTAAHLKAIDFNRNPQGIYVGNDYFYPEQVGYAVGSGGAITKSMDYGATWSSKPPTAASADWKGASFYTVVGAGGSTLSTSTKGASWPTKGVTGVTTTLRGVSSDTRSGPVAVGDSGTILLDTSSYYAHGTTWQAQTSPTTENLRAVAAGRGIDYVVGTHGTILSSTDDRAWTVVSTGGTAALPKPSIDFTSVSYSDSNTGYACSSLGKIAKTTDAGLTWSTLSSGTSTNLAGISFIPATSTGVTVGDGGRILKTTNGGASWSDKSFVPATPPAPPVQQPTFGIKSVYFTDANTGWAVGENMGISKTTDGGKTWTAQTSPVQGGGSGPTFLLKFGSQGTGDGQFSVPYGIAVDSSDNSYVVDYTANRIEKFNSAGAFVTKWGTSGTGDGQFTYPAAVAVDSSGNVYVVDRGNHRIQKFGSSGTFIAKWGSLGSGDGQFNYPAAIAVDGSGNVYVYDQLNYRIEKFSSSGTFIAKWGTPGNGDGQFNYTVGIAVDGSGNVYATDAVNYRVQKFSSDGTFIRKWGTQGTGDGQFMAPYGIAVSSSGNVYVVDGSLNRTEKFSSDGTFISAWGTTGSGDGQFKMPMFIATGSSNKVYITDYMNYRVEVFQDAPPSTSPKNLNKVFFVDASNGFAVGNNGVILATTNGGTTWTAKTTPPGIGDVYGVAATSSSTAWVGGTSGIVYKTTNGGTSWAAQTLRNPRYSSVISWPGSPIRDVYIYSSGTSGMAVGDAATAYTYNMDYSYPDTWSYTGTSYYLQNTGIPTTTNFTKVSNGFRYSNGVYYSYVTGTGGIIFRMPYQYYDIGAKATTPAGLESTDFIGISSMEGGYSSGSCFIVGTGGVILKTTNTGATWTAQTSGAMSNLNAINQTGNIAYAGGDSATLLKTIDGGTTWASTTPAPPSAPPKPNLRAVSMPSSTGYAVGSNGSILKTTDSGDTWTNETNLTGANGLNGVVTTEDGSLSLIVGDNGTMLRRTSPTSAWITDTPLTTNTLNSVSTARHAVILCGMTSCDTVVQYIDAYVAGNGGTLLYRDSYNSRWTSVSTGTTANLYGMLGWQYAYYVGTSGKPIYSTQAIAVGANSTIVRTTSGAGTGTVVYKCDWGPTLRSAQYDPITKSVYAFGDGGLILKSSDQGNTWGPIVYDTSKDLNGVATDSPVQGSEVAVVGDGGTIRQYQYGTWKNISTCVNENLNAVTFDYDDSGYTNAFIAVGNNGTIVISSNYGNAPWSTIYSSNTANRPTTADLLAVQAVTYATTNYATGTSTGKVVFAVGAAGTILKSIDRGATWTSLRKPDGSAWTNVNLTGLYFYDNSIGYVSGDTGLILQTTNGGTTWTITNNPAPQVLPTSNLNGVSLAGPTEVFAVGDNGVILHTTNGGSTWSNQTPVSTPLYDVASNVIGMSSIAVGSNGVILTYSGSDAWTKVSVPGVAGALWGVTSHYDDAGHVIALAAGDNGVILRSTTAGGSWTQIPAASKPDVGTTTLVKVQFGSTSYGNSFAVASSGNGQMFVSWNDGLNWTKLNTGVSNGLYGLGYVSGGQFYGSTLIAAGTSGIILRAVPYIQYNCQCNNFTHYNTTSGKYDTIDCSSKIDCVPNYQNSISTQGCYPVLKGGALPCSGQYTDMILPYPPTQAGGTPNPSSCTSRDPNNLRCTFEYYSTPPFVGWGSSPGYYCVPDYFVFPNNRKACFDQTLYYSGGSYKQCGPAPSFETYFDNRYTCKYGQASTPTSPNQAPCLLYTMPYLFGWGETRACDRWQMFKAACSLKSSLLSDFGGVTKCNTLNGDYKCYTDYSKSVFGTQVCSEAPSCALDSGWVNDPAGKYCTINTATQSVPYTDPLLQPGESMVIPSIRGSDTGGGFGCSGSTCFSYTSLPDMNYTVVETPTGSNATITVKRLDALIGVGASRLFPTDGDLSPFSAITINNYEKQSRTMNLAFVSTSGATTSNSITVPAFGSDQTDQPGTSIVAPGQFLPPNGTGNFTISSALGTTRIIVSDVRITRNITVTAAGFGLSTLAADTQSKICFTSTDRERKINIYKNGKQVTGGTTFGTATPNPAAHCAMTKNCIGTSPDVKCTGIQSSTNPDCSYTVQNAQAGCTKSTGTTCTPLRAGISCAYNSTLGKCLFKGDESAASLVCGASCTTKSPAVDSLLTCSKAGSGCAFQYKSGGEKTSSSNVFCQIFYDVNGLLCRPTGAYSDIGCTSKRTGALTPDMTNCYLTPPPAASGSTLVSNEYCNVQWEKVTITSGPCAGSYYNATSCSVNKGGSAMPDSMYPVSCNKVAATSPSGCGLNTCSYSTSPQPPYTCTSDLSCPCMKCGKSPDFSFAPNIGCTPTSEGCKVNTSFAVDTSGVCAVSQGTTCTPNYDGAVCGVDSSGNCQMQATETPDTGLVKYCVGDPSGCESFDQNLNCTFVQTTDPNTGQTSKNCTVSSFQPSYCWDSGDEGSYIIEDATTLKTMIINRFNKNQQLNIDLMRSYVIPDAVNTSPGSQVCFYSSDGGTHNLTTSDGRAMKVGPSDICTCTRPSCIIYGPSKNYNYYNDDKVCKVVGWVTQGPCPHNVLMDPCNPASSTYSSCQDPVVVYGNSQDKIGDPFTLDPQFNPRNCTTSASCTNIKDCQRQGDNWWLMCKGLDAYGRPYGSSYPEYCPLNATPPWSTTFAPGAPYTMYLGMFRQVEGPCLETSCSALAKYCPPFPESDRPYYVTVSDPEFIGASATISSSTQNVTINVYQKTFDPEYGLIRPDGTLTFNNKDLVSHTIYRTDTETGTSRYAIPSSTPDPTITVLSETAFACDGNYGSNGDRIKLQLSLPANTIALSVTSAFNDNGQIYFNGYTVPGTAHTRCVDKVHVLSSPSSAQVPTNYINQMGSTTNNVTIELCSCNSTDKGNLSVSFLYTYLNPQKLGNVTIGTIKPEESITLANLPLGQKAYFVQDGKGAFNLQVKTCEGSDMNDMAGKIGSYERQDYAPPTNTICDSGGQTGCTKFNPYGPSTVAILTTEQGLNFSNPNDVQCAKDEVTSIKSTCQRCTSAINVGEANRSVVKTLLDDAKARGSTDIVARTVLLNNMPNCTFSDLMDSIINDSKFSLYTYQKPSIILDFGLKSGSNKAGTCSWTNETIGKAYDDLFLLWTPQLAGAGIIGLSQTCYSDPCPLLNYYGFYTENGAAKDYTDAWFKKGCGGYYYNSEGLTMTTFGMTESQYVACDPSKVFAMLQGFLCTINSTGITIPR